MDTTVWQAFGLTLLAGLSTGIGSHAGEEEGDDQFEISDTRNVEQVLQGIRSQGLQPVMNDYVYL